MKDCRSVIARMAQACGVKTDTELADKLEIKRNTIASWKNRGSVPYEQAVIVAEQKNVTLDWLLTGEGPMRRGDASGPHKASNVASGDEAMRLFVESNELLQGYGTGLYNDMRDQLLAWLIRYRIDGADMRALVEKILASQK